MNDIFNHLPSFQQRNDSVPKIQKNDSTSFAYFLMRVDQAACFSGFIWPNIIKKDGFFLREDAIPENWDLFIEEARKANWSNSDIEFVFNKPCWGEVS